MRTKEPTEWVVYQAATDKAALGGRTAVCSQDEWDEIERATPGRHALIRAHIGSEADAERQARTLFPATPPPAAPTPADLRRRAVRQARIVTLAQTAVEPPAPAAEVS